MIRSSAILPALLLAPSTAAFAQPYSADRSGDVVRLRDTRIQTIVLVVPSVGNIAFDMNV
jgi:hypothetical protein